MVRLLQRLQNASTTNRQVTNDGDDETRMDGQGGRSQRTAHGGPLPTAVGFDLIWFCVLMLPDAVMGAVPGAR